jgi:hypothetical protein
MKLRFMHGESYVTYCGKGEYVIDTSKFPELDGKSEEEVVKWLYENQESVAVNTEYTDDDPNKHVYNNYDVTYEIVPLEKGDAETATLYDYTSDSSVIWDKIKNEEDYFRFMYDIDKRKMSSEELLDEIKKNEEERIKNGLYNI